VGGDMAAEVDKGALLKIDDPGGREKSDDPVSRAGRSGSDPSIAEMDMLLPGRWDGALGASRESRDEAGALVDCDRAP
jgi:hypothetical protein